MYKKLIILFKDEIFQNTFLSMSSKGIGMIMFLISDIIVARYLSVDNYGEWSFFYSFASMLFWIAWFGINIATKVFVAEDTNPNEQAKNIISGIKLRFLVSVVLMLVIMLSSGGIAGFLGFPSKYPNLNYLILLSGILVFFNSFSEFFKEICVGLNNFKYIFYITTLEFGGYLVFGCGMLYLFGDIVALEIGYIVTVITVTVFGMIFIIRKYYPLYKKHKHNFQTTVLMKKIFKYSLPLAVISIGAMILLEMDTFMIGMFSTSEEVAIYAIGKKLYSKATHVNLALSTATMTVFALLNEENFPRLKKRFHKICTINLIMTILIALVFFILGPIAIKVLYGDEFAGAGYVIWSLTLYYILYSVSLFYSAFLDFQKRAKARSGYYFIMIILNLVFNVMLIPKFGAIGASIGTSISMLPYVAFLIWDTNKTFHKYEQLWIQKKGVN